MTDIYSRLASVDNPEEVIQIARDLSELPKDVSKKIGIWINRLSEKDPAAEKIMDQYRHGDIDVHEVLDLVGQL